MTGNRKKATKFTKTPILGVQGHLRSATLIPIKSLSLDCYEKQHVRAYLQPFYATRDNCGKITTFRGVADFDARLRRPP